MEKHEKPYENTKFNLSGPTKDKRVELPNGSYSIANIQDFLINIFI